MTIRVEGEEDEAEFGKSARQDCSLFLISFKLYIEYVIKELREKFKARVSDCSW